MIRQLESKDSAVLTKASENQETKYVRAVVTISPLNAARTFESCGFMSYGIERRGIKEGSNFFDQSFMALDLRD